MRLRRVFFILISGFLLTSAFLGGTAFAGDTFVSDGVTVSNIRIEPAALSGDGEVAVTINIAVDTSRAEGGLANVQVVGDTVKASGTVGAISIGENSDLNFSIELTAAQLGTALPLKAVWDGSSSGIAFTVTIPSTAATEPKVSFTRTIDKTTVETGGSVAITYVVKNTGNIDITDLVITDNGIGDDFKITEPSLPAGTVMTKTLNYDVNSDFTSSPRLAYKAGDKSFTAQCPDKSVKLKVVELGAVLRAILPDTLEPGGEATLVCELVNSGSVKLTSIVIDEATLGKRIFTAAALDKDASMQFSRTVVLMKTTQFQYTITAKDDAGNTVTVKSNELEVAVDSGSDQYSIEIMASPDAIQLAEPGQVNFEVTVTNKGAEPVQNVMITDQNGEVLTTYETLPVGVSKFTKMELIDKTKVFDFILKVAGPDGDYVRSTGQIEIIVTEPTASPQVTAAATATPEPTATGAVETSGKPVGSIGDIIIIMLVVGGLIVVAIIVLAITILTDKLKKRKMRK